MTMLTLYYAVGSDYEHSTLVLPSGHFSGHCLQHHSKVHRDTEPQVQLLTWKSGEDLIRLDTAVRGKGDRLQLRLYLSVGGTTRRH